VRERRFQPMAKSREELTIFVERYAHFLNLWTIYCDLGTGFYVPSVGPGVEPNVSAYQSFFEPGTTMMLIVYAYFYSLIEDSSDGINAFRVWREHFPEDEQAIAAIEAQITPFQSDLRIYRNRLGFHGSRSKAHEAKGFDLFANATGTVTWNAIKNFKALAATLLAKDMASRSANDAELLQYSAWIDAIAARARRQTNP